MTTIDIGAKINLERLIDSRLLVQGNSGSGKSVVVRNILEEVHDKVMFIILDIEGEYFTLREKYDVLLIGGNSGDIPISMKAAPLLPKKIMELKVSTIIDMSDLKKPDRIAYVKNFLTSLMELPKQYWQPCLVVIEEAHSYCGQQEKQDSTWAVIDLMTRGRKRGFSGLLITQRIAKLHKDAAAECNSKLIGRTFLDIDMKRAAEELGFTSKTDMLSLRDLKPGEFYALGTAVNPHHVHKVKINKPRTTHPKVGMDIKAKPIPPTPQIKSMLTKLSELPKEAEKERLDKEALQKKVRELEFQIRTQKPQADDKSLSRIKDEYQKRMEKEVRGAYDRAARENQSAFQNHIKRIEFANRDLQNRIIQIAKIAGAKINIQPIEKMPTVQPRVMHVPLISQQALHKDARAYVSLDRETRSFEDGESITGGALRMLKAAAMFYPDSITRARMAAIAGLSYKSGTFGTYTASLIRQGYLVRHGDSFKATEEGMQSVGDVPELPTDPESLINMWRGILKGGPARMLKVVADCHPDSISKEDLGEQSGFSSNSGTFGTYLAILKRNGLIKVHGREITLSEEIYGG